MTEKLSLKNRLDKLQGIVVRPGTFEDHVDEQLTAILKNVSRYYTSPNNLLKTIQEPFFNYTANCDVPALNWDFYNMVVFMYLLGIEFPENLMAVKKYLDSKDSTLLNTIKSHLNRSRSSEFGEVMGIKDNKLYFKNMNDVIKRLTFLYKATKGDDMSMETFEETIDNKTPLTVVFDFIFLVCFDFIDQLYRMCTVFLLFLNEPMLAAGYRHLFSMREHLDYELGEFYLIKAEYIEKMELEKARENPLRYNNKYMFARTFVFFLPVLFMCNLHVSPKSFQIEARHCSLAETFVLSPMNSMAEYMNSFSVKDVFKSKKVPMAITLPKAQPQYQEQRAQPKYQAPPEPEEEEISVMDLIYNTDNTPFTAYQDSGVLCFLPRFKTCFLKRFASCLLFSSLLAIAE